MLCILEVGCGLEVYSHPADILVQNWIIGKPAAFDLTVALMLTITLNAKGRHAGGGGGGGGGDLGFRV